MSGNSSLQQDCSVPLPPKIMEITCDDFDEAVAVAKKARSELKNLLDGQETLDKHVDGED